MKEEEPAAADGSPTVSAGSETPASSAHTAKSKKVMATALRCRRGSDDRMARRLRMRARSTRLCFSGAAFQRPAEGSQAATVAEGRVDARERARPCAELPADVRVRQCAFEHVSLAAQRSSQEERRGVNACRELPCPLGRDVVGCRVPEGTPSWRLRKSGRVGKPVGEE